MIVRWRSQAAGNRGKTECIFFSFCRTITIFPRLPNLGSAMRHHGEYWILPLIAAAVWTATLIALLCVWIFGDRHVVYEVSESYVVFISDVGAAHQKLFIAGTGMYSCLTA